jgi:hypothetical protein
MDEEIKKLIAVFTDESMTGEGRASILAYARGRLDAQRELARRTADVPAVKAEKPHCPDNAYLE